MKSKRIFEVTSELFWQKLFAKDLLVAQRDEFNLIRLQNLIFICSSNQQILADLIVMPNAQLNALLYNYSRITVKDNEHLSLIQRSPSSLAKRDHLIYLVKNRYFYFRQIAEHYHVLIPITKVELSDGYQLPQLNYYRLTKITASDMLFFKLKTEDAIVLWFDRQEKFMEIIAAGANIKDAKQTFFPTMQIFRQYDNLIIEDLNFVIPEQVLPI